jgi:hypothetical protein
LVRNAGFTAVSVFALALGIGVYTAVFTAYKAFIARPLDARDPGTVVNFALRLQSGVNNATFSYPDCEAYGAPDKSKRMTAAPSSQRNLGAALAVDEAGMGEQWNSVNRRTRLSHLLVGSDYKITELMLYESLHLATERKAEEDRQRMKNY